MSADSNGNPLYFELITGNVADVTMAGILLEHIDLTHYEVLSADKGYDKGIIST